MKKISISILFVLLYNISSFACTNFLVTKGASADSSSMITYAADSHLLYGELYFTPAADYPEGSKLKVHEWDTGKYLGEIDQVSHTYSVVGNMNEYQVAIGETTYGGRHGLNDSTAIIDYGSLMYITLQRAKSAREAIKIMSELVSKYGYYSEGESMSISDPNEVWILEIIGKGVGNKGAVWVARQIPDGYISAHANQARITTFPFSKKNKWFDSKQTTFHSADVISFAKEQKFYVGSDAEFSFSDVYAPVDFGGARFCEIRVWAFFNAVNKDMSKYWDYSKGDVKHSVEHKEGEPLTPANFATNRMPLWIKPDAKINVHQMMDFMRDHLEGTELDMRNDLGAGPFGNPYRWRPLTWEVDGKEYCNERATATQQTGFSFVTQSRSWLPKEVGGIFWFGVDDAASTVYFPMYTSVTEVPKSYAQGNGDLMTYTTDAAFWVFNMVSNFAYTRYNVIWPEIKHKQLELELNYISESKMIEEQAVRLIKENQLSESVGLLTDFSVKTGEKTRTTWLNFYGELFAKYMDGNVKKKAEPKENYKFVVPELSQPGYGENWYKRIVNETDGQFLYKSSSH